MSQPISNLFDGAAGGATAALGVFVAAYGVLALPASGLGGAWILAVGLSLLAAVLVGSTRGRQAFGLSPEGGRRVALALVALAVLLGVAFVAVNGVTFTGPFSESRSG